MALSAQKVDRRRLMMAYKMLFVFIADKDAIAISDKYKHYIYDNCNLEIIFFL